MECLAIGGVGFAMILFYDLSQVAGKEQLSGALSSIGYAAVSASVVFPLLSLRPSAAPLARQLLLAALAAVSFFLLVYSVLIEVPLTLRRRGRVGERPRRVVAEGTYACVRHPGFLWFALCLIALALLYRRRQLTEVAAALVLLDFLLVLLEDLVLFPRIFVDYAEYKKRVPFIAPRLPIRR